jgi:C4-dicarboxylate-specific signal transduction histidine kinase
MAHLQSSTEPPTDRPIGNSATRSGAGAAGGIRVLSIQALLGRRILAIALIQAAVLLAIAKWQLYPEIEQLQSTLNSALANNIARTANDAFARSLQAIEATASALNANPGTNQAIQLALVRQLVQSQPAAESAYIISAAGKIETIAMAARLQASGDVANRRGLDMSRNLLFLKRNRTKASISPVFLSSVSEQLQVAVTAPLEYGALLVIEIGLSSLAREVNATVTGSDVLVLISDNSGQLVANPDANRQGQSVMLPLEMINNLSRPSSTVVTWAEQRWLATSAPVGQLDWWVVVMRPEARVKAPIDSIVQLLLVATALLLLFSYAALVYATRSMQQATQTLMADARLLEQGTIPPEHHFRILEWRQIDASLRTLAHALLNREALLQQSNDALEARVQQRTQHLEEVNAELNHAMLRLHATQDELVQSGKMAALGSMVAGVAHELNTPVGNARLVATTLLDRSLALTTMLAGERISRREIDQIAKDFQNAAEIIDKSLGRAADLVRSFKQVASDQTSNQRRRFKLSDVVRENELLLSPRLHKAGVTLTVDVPPELAMDSFPGDLGQVITNLVDNAVLHAYADRPGGGVDLRAVQQGDDVVRITITDQGHGMDSATMGRIFDPFFTTRMGRGGTGLGLSIVYSIVSKSLGGKISVASVPGSGTSFTLELAQVAPGHADPYGDQAV